GVFLVDTSADGVFNPSSKPLADRMTQRAVLVRDRGMARGWRVVQLSPQDWTVVDASRQTVGVTDVKVYRNDTLLVDVTDPSALYDVGARVPRFHLGDTVKVVTAVSNTTNSGFTPSPFVFLHVRHSDPLGRSWHRLKMEDNGDGTWQRRWTPRPRPASRPCVCRPTRLSVCVPQPRSAGVSTRTVRIAIVVAGLMVVSTSAQAQRRMRGGRAVRVERPGVGPRVGYDFDTDHAFLGGQFNFPVGRRWALAPSADFYLGTTGTPYRLNVDVKFHPP